MANSDSDAQRQLAEFKERTERAEKRLAQLERRLSQLETSSAAVPDHDVKQMELPPCNLSVEERFRLCMSVAEETTTESDLMALVSKKQHPVCYDGFEPSGRMHIAQGVMKAIIVNKLAQAGCKFIFWVADWFALLNNKMGGDLNKIQTVGQYFIEIWKASGMQMESVEFKWASEEINKNPNEYWLRVMDIARRNNLNRLQRCATIMGRDEGSDMPAAQILYPCMQCADIFFLKADICQLGMDQRKVNMLAREYCEEKEVRKQFPHKPVILSHHMLLGLDGTKMSKSSPDSAIFMEDTASDVNRKLKKAFCPPQQVADNPCLEYAKYIVFGKLGAMTVRRSEQNGGNKQYTSYQELQDDYESGNLHPSDLKTSLAAAINEIIEPVRQHFTNNPEASRLLQRVKQYRTTR